MGCRNIDAAGFAFCRPDPYRAHTSGRRPIKWIITHNLAVPLNLKGHLTCCERAAVPVAVGSPEFQAYGVNTVSGESVSISAEEELVP